MFYHSPPNSLSLGLQLLCWPSSPRSLPVSTFPIVLVLQARTAMLAILRAVNSSLGSRVYAVS